MAADDLHMMLGLPPDTRPADLRIAYERAVADAARSHNIRRATQLSNAFDRLPLPVRETLYPSRGVAPSAYWDTPRPNHRHRTRWGWIPGVVALAVVGFLVARHFGFHMGSHGSSQAAPVATSEVVSPTAQSPIEVRGTPAGELIAKRYREWLPPQGAVVDASGATEGHCVAAKRHRPLAPLAWVASGSLMVCPTGSAGFFLASP